MNGALPEWPTLAFVVLQNLGFALAIGVLAVHRWCGDPALAWHRDIRRHGARILRAALLTSIAASVVAFWLHCASMSETPLAQTGPAVCAPLLGTGFGRAWLVNAAALSGATLLAWRRGDDGALRHPVLLAALLAIGALARSHSGHPVDAGRFSPPVWIDWLHLLAISVWVGIVLLAAFAVVPRLRRDSGSAGGGEFMQALSDTATVALVVLVGTGAFNGWRNLGSGAALLDSTYGAILAVKLGFVATAAALGGYNRCAVMPALMRAVREPASPDWRHGLARFQTVLRIEAATLAIAMLAAARLAGSPLPGTG
ncbi:copper resistance D family protein [Burkholderia alba]|uniref:copper resistance D family protein n=1 Tax=Burkholderia alba TaxID=2683677 RepID=UPI002B053007|nr:CopD family protein [Burkholderia alba]